LTALTDKDGNVKERQAFDPCGNRRNPDDWTKLVTTPVSHITGLGYTMHEHLDDFALINMNGRVYDPQIARFLSPDPQLQAPGYWLNYNRYGYCFNNPMIYSDPSGEFFWAALPLLAKIAIGVGAGVGAYSGYKIGDAKGASGLGMVGYMLGGAAVGGAASLAGVGIGTGAIGGLTGMDAVIAGGVAAGVINGGGMTAIAGGSWDQVIGGVIQGAVVGGFTSAVGYGAFQATDQFLTNYNPRGLLWRMLLGNIPFHNTITYMASSTASQMTGNILLGKGIFSNLDYGLNPGIIIPLYGDIGSRIPAIKTNITKKHYVPKDDYKVAKAYGGSRTEVQENGDLVAHTLVKTEKYIPEHFKQSFFGSLKRIPSYTDTQYFNHYNPVIIPFYRNIIITINVLSH
jgi:RHS repeat-associated protein